MFAPQDKDLITDQMRTAVEMGQKVSVVGINLAKNLFNDASQLLAGGRSWFYLEDPLPQNMDGRNQEEAKEEAAYKLGTFTIEGESDRQSSGRGTSIILQIIYPAHSTPQWQPLVAQHGS